MPNESDRLDLMIAAESGPNNSDAQYEAWRDEQPSYQGYDEWMYQQEAIKEEDDV